MALTAIVIGLAITALLLVIVLRVARRLPRQGPRRRWPRRRPSATRAWSARRPAEHAAGGGGRAMTALGALAADPVGGGRRARPARRAPARGRVVGGRRAGRRPGGRSSCSAASVLSDGPVTATTGDWPAGRRASTCAPTRSACSSPGCRSFAVLAATVHEVAHGVRERVFPGLVVLLAAGPHRRVPHRRPLQLLRLLRAGDDRRLRARHLRRHAPRARRARWSSPPSTCSARSSSCSRSPASTTSPARWTWPRSRRAWATSSPTPRS